MGIRAEYDDERQGYVAITKQPLILGQELLFFYGDDCIEDSVNTRGFAGESAPPCEASSNSR